MLRTRYIRRVLCTTRHWADTHLGSVRRACRSWVFRVFSGSHATYVSLCLPFGGDVLGLCANIEFIEFSSLSTFLQQVSTFKQLLLGKKTKIFNIKFILFKVIKLGWKCRLYEYSNILRKNKLNFCLFSSVKYWKTWFFDKLIISTIYMCKNVIKY